MMKFVCAIVFLFVAVAPIAAETLVAARTIRSQTIITAMDLRVIADGTPGALRGTSEAVGLEAKVIIYEGRPLWPGDVGPAAIVERNQIVQLVYQNGGLTISTEGRVLDRGGPGDRLRVMNLSSRATVSGTVLSNGQVMVGPIPPVTQ